MSKIFFDTNILIYLFDVRFPEKQEVVHSLFEKMREENSEGVLSTQVLQEFFVVATKKLGLSVFEVKSILKSLEEFEIVSVNPEIISEAIDIGMLHQLSFWDSLILASAKCAHANILWTEDLQHGQSIQGVQIINPFLS